MFGSEQSIPVRQSGNDDALLTRALCRTQPWSTYAVHQTTIVHWAFLWDFLIIYTFLMCSQPWSSDERKLGLYVLFAWMFVSKFVKLIGHYVRYPFDFLLLPVSIVFGYLHGLIKAKAMLSLNVVSCKLPCSIPPVSQAQ